MKTKKQKKCKEYKEKFIVLNRKHLKIVKEKNKEVIVNLVSAINEFSLAFKEITGKKLDQEYYCCNQDEDYAKDVLDIILGDNEWTPNYPDKLGNFLFYGFILNKKEPDLYLFKIIKMGNKLVATCNSRFIYENTENNTNYFGYFKKLGVKTPEIDYNEAKEVIG